MKPNRVLFCTLSGRSSKQDVCWCWKSINQSWIILHILVSHFAFSSNLFHGKIVQIFILQLSDSENKKCNPWKVFGLKHPQTLQLLLSRRGPRSPNMRLSQHYIGAKITFQHFSNFCRKKFPGLKKKLLHNSIQF